MSMVLKKYIGFEIEIVFVRSSPVTYNKAICVTKLLDVDEQGVLIGSKEHMKYIPFSEIVSIGIEGKVEL